MELDDLKNSWEEATKQINIPVKMIDRATHAQYKSNLKKIVYPEIIGSIICFLGAVYIGCRFNELGNGFVKGIGILAIGVLVVLPILSFISLLQFNSIGDVNKPYAETLKDFAIQKIRFHTFMKINSTLCYLLLVSLIIVCSKFFGEKDIYENTYFWILSFSGGYIFLLFYSKWVAKYYKNTLQQTEDLLKELES